MWLLGDGGEHREVLFQIRVLGTRQVAATSATFQPPLPPFTHQCPRLRSGVTSPGVFLCTASLVGGCSTSGLGKGLGEGSSQGQNLGSGVKMWGLLKLVLKAPQVGLASCSAMEKVLIIETSPSSSGFRVWFFFSFVWGFFSPKNSSDICSDLPHTELCLSIPLQGKKRFHDCFFEGNSRKV